MKNIEIKDIMDEAKDRYYYAMDSNSKKEIEATIKYFAGIRHKILHDKYLACSEGANDTIYMLDDFDRALTIHHYILGKY